MNYTKFKKIVFINAQFRCENPCCNNYPETVHHFFKQSKYPKYKMCPDNGMAVCGRCHAEIERRERQGEDLSDIIPMDRYNKMLEKINDNIGC